jgi:glycosyltransferase involved in cell wall biosynthesis
MGLFVQDHGNDPAHGYCKITNLQLSLPGVFSGKHPVFLYLRMVSVIMAAHNAQDYLDTALDSVFAQSFKDFEVVVVDDASSDKTHQMLDACKDPRLKVFRNEVRSGAAFSRNRAITEASGRYVAILDADDFWAPEKLEEQVGFMEKHPSAAALGTYVYETDQTGRRNKAVRFPLYPGQIRCSTLFRCSLVHSSVMIRRSFLDEQNIWYDQSFSFSHDFELWSRAVFAGNFHLLPRYLTYYRRRPGQISSENSVAQNKHASRVFCSMLQKMGFQPQDEELAAHLRLSGLVTGTVNEQKYYRDILMWCIALYKRNEKNPVFRPYLLANEILLRFLKYCTVNSFGPLKTLRLMLSLHWNLPSLFFPYLQLFQRMSRRINDV